MQQQSLRGSFKIRTLRALFCKSTKEGECFATRETTELGKNCLNDDDR